MLGEEVAEDGGLLAKLRGDRSRVSFVGGGSERTQGEKEDARHADGTPQGGRGMFPFFSNPHSSPHGAHCGKGQEHRTNARRKAADHPSIVNERALATRGGERTQSKMRMWGEQKRQRVIFARCLATQRLSRPAKRATGCGSDGPSVCLRDRRSKPPFVVADAPHRSSRRRPCTVDRRILEGKENF